MTISLRQGAIFASGILLGAAAAVWVVRGAQEGAPAAPDRRVASEPPPQPAAVALREVPKAPPSAPTVTSALQPQPHPHAACPAQATATAVGDKDGHFVLQTNIDAKTAVDIPSFILAGKEAAAAGRPRDAEVAFLMACRVADALRGADSVEAADSRYQLARHYAALVQGGGAASTTRTELSARAEALYADSVATYRAKYGDQHEKSRFAAEGLASLRQAASSLPRGSAVAVAAQAPAAPVKPVAPPVSTKPVLVAPAIVAAAPPSPLSLPSPPPPAPAARVTPKLPLPAAAPRRVEVAAAEPPVRQATGQASLQTPSFDCARARSKPEQIICSDPQLSQLDRELGRLHARARAASPDPSAFRRQNEQEWRNREASCRDRECLLRWYAHRRDQLLDELDAAGNPGQPTIYR